MKNNIFRKNGGKLLESPTREMRFLGGDFHT